MEALFADTSYLVATFNEDDRSHRAAETLTEELADGRHGSFRLYMTDYVFDETVTMVLTQTKRHDLAATAGKAIRSSKAFRLERLSDPDFEAGWEMFLEREDKRWSFTDCTSFAFMERRGIRRAASFDRNFKQAGFATLP